jgi:hypothetical protein
MVNDSAIKPNKSPELPEPCAAATPAAAHAQKPALPARTGRGPQ